MLEYKKDVGIKFTDLLKVEHAEKAHTPDILNGKEVADLAKGLFDRLSPKLNYRLVDSNVVLTLAGLKPSTWFAIDVATPHDVEDLKKQCEQANGFLAADNSYIRFSVEGKSGNLDPGSKQKESSIIFVRNLLGYERVTQSTHISQIPKFDHSQGFEGMQKWYQQAYINLHTAKQDGELPKYYDINSILEGIEYGYPDTAIIDMEEWDNAGRPEGKISDSEVPNSQIYKAADPNFLFLTEHSEDEGIKKYINQASPILSDFYESNWHKEKANDLSFHLAK